MIAISWPNNTPILRKDKFICILCACRSPMTAIMIIATVKPGAHKSERITGNRDHQPAANGKRFRGTKPNWLWAIDSIRASTRDLVSGYPGKTHLPGQSRIWAYPGIRANWRGLLASVPGQKKAIRVEPCVPGHPQSTWDTV